MSKKPRSNANRKPNRPSHEKKVLAFTGLAQGRQPYAPQDLLAEPTKKREEYETNDYIPFFSYSNYELDNIFAIVENSPTVGAVINQKTAYCMSEGFYAEPSTNNTFLPILRNPNAVVDDMVAAQQINDFAKRLNNQGDTLEDQTQKVFDYLFSYGNCFILLKRYTAGGERKFTSSILPLYMCRPKKAAQGELYPEYIGFSEYFEEGLSTDRNAYNYSLYPNWEINEEGVECSVIHIKQSKPTFRYWGLPDWIAAKIWGELEYRIPKFNQSEFENGFHPSSIVSLYGATNEKEASNLIDNMVNTFTSTENHSKMFIQALRDDTQKAEVQQLDSRMEGQFMDLQAMAQQAIITAMGWTTSLAGIKTSGELGSNQQIKAEFDRVYTSTIQPAQRLVLNKYVNPMIQAAGEWFGYNWKDIVLNLKKPQPINVSSELDYNTILTLNEKRKAAGFEPLENESDLTDEPTN